jgi:hypothetical protein
MATQMATQLPPLALRRKARPLERIAANRTTIFPSSGSAFARFPQRVAGVGGMWRGDFGRGGNGCDAYKNGERER